MANTVELTRLKIAADVLADVDRRGLYRDEAEELEKIEDQLLALASRLSDERRERSAASNLRNPIELPN